MFTFRTPCWAHKSISVILFEFNKRSDSLPSSCSRPQLLSNHFHFPQTLTSPHQPSIQMPEAPPPPTSLRHNLTQAITICETLQQSLLCTACNRPYHNERPWRSRNCDHTFCASCAAAARGERELVVPREGKCPVQTCDLPLRPADVVEDVGVRGVLDACRGLVSWAADATNSDSVTVRGGHKGDLFDGDVRLGAGLVASQ